MRRFTATVLVLVAMAPGGVALAQQLDVAPEQVLPFSTGVIMEPLPSERIIAGLPAAQADAPSSNRLRVTTVRGRAATIGLYRLDRAPS